MGWDAELKRKLAVPLALYNCELAHESRSSRKRTLSRMQEDPLGFAMLTKLAENRDRIDRLRKDVELHPNEVDCSDITNELDYLKATIEFNLLEVENGISEIPSADEILMQEIVVA